MIKFDERFSFERDRYQWLLHEWRMGKDKHGNDKLQCDTTYHATLAQVCGVIIDRSCGDCESLEEIKDLLVKAIESIQPEPVTDE